MTTLKWVGDSGPPVCLPEANAAAWLGCWRPVLPEDDHSLAERIEGRLLIVDGDPVGASTDYAHACAALRPETPVALIPFSNGVALALETMGQSGGVCSGR